MKSASSTPDITMSPLGQNALQEWKLARPSGCELVFPGRGGRRPVSYNTLCSDLGGIHRFRHWFASWLIDQGFGPKRVQELMGHSSIGMTLDLYTHLWPREDDHEKFAA